jgi:hypothetical protein
MDFQKAQLFLDKINREMSRMQSAPNQIAQIDIDLFKNYIRELYDVCTDDAKPHTFPQRTERVATVSGPKTISVTEEESKKAEPIKFTPERAVVAPAQPQPPKPAVTVAAAPTPIVEAIKAPIEPSKPVERILEKPTPPPTPVEEVVYTPAPAPQPAPARSMTASRKVQALFNLPEAKEISEKLARSPLTDIKKGMNLNDRLQWPTALFGGDQGLFEQAVERVNIASSFEDAAAFLADIAEQNDWANSHKDDVAHSFILLVGRRFGK